LVNVRLQPEAIVLVASHIAAVTARERPAGGLLPQTFAANERIASPGQLSLASLAVNSCRWARTAGSGVGPRFRVAELVLRPQCRNAGRSVGATTTPGFGSTPNSAWAA